MKIPSRGSFAALALCATAAAAVSVTPALAAEQPGGTTWDRTGNAAQDDVLGETVDGLATEQTAQSRPPAMAQGPAGDPAAVDQGLASEPAPTHEPAPTQGAPAQAAPAGPVQSLMGLGMPGRSAMAHQPITQADFGTAKEPRVPLVVPLRTMGGSLFPVDAPKMGGSVPVSPVEQPAAQDMTPEMTENGVAPRATVPSLSTTGAPTAFLEAPVPTVQDGGSRSAARLDAPKAPLRTAGPGATLDLPIHAPRDGRQGLPELRVPDAGVTPPSAKGDPGAGVGLTPRNEEQRLPLGALTRTATGIVPEAGQAVGSAPKGLDTSPR
ncbi:hypothetical protein [Streptomyces sp. NPDC048639]|uniref:hypothetical protein n=1 Tax=Streptomyces sp. NPDC048639 TaxID=3365581 RepID=UPI0037164DF6